MEIRCLKQWKDSAAIKSFIASTMQTEVFKNSISLLGWYCYSCDVAIKIELPAMIKKFSITIQKEYTDAGNRKKIK